jgi:hypothetical protein
VKTNRYKTVVKTLRKKKRLTVKRVASLKHHLMTILHHLRAKITGLEQQAYSTLIEPLTLNIFSSKVGY